MKYIGLMNISFQQINAFLAVAKHMNMTKAAESIYVTQPLLSQKISALEDEIGVQLFTRKQRRLLITPAGQYLYENWSSIINSIEDNVETARLIQEREEKSINISFCYGISIQKMIKIVNCLREKNPNLKITCQSMEIFQMRNELLEHRTDIAIAPNYDLDNFEGSIQHVPILDCRIKTIVGKAHPLAERNSLDWSDLKDRNILCQPASKTGGYERCITNICQLYGFTPRLVQCNNIFSATSQMMLGDGILVGVFAPVAVDDINCVTFEMPNSTIPLMLAYHINASEKVYKFLDKNMNTWKAMFSKQE